MKISQLLKEIEMGGSMSSIDFDEINDDDFESKQLNLFPDIPTIIPNIPKGYQYIGRMQNYAILKKIEDKFTTFVIILYGKLVAYVLAIKASDYKYSHIFSDNSYGLQIKGTYVGEQYRGKRISILFYQWLLQHVCDYILPDDRHTNDGVKLWKKLNNSKLFDLYVYNPNTGTSRKRWAGKDFFQIYRNDSLIPFLTLKGRYVDNTDDYVSDVKPQEIEESKLNEIKIIGSSLYPEMFDVFKNEKFTKNMELFEFSGSIGEFDIYYHIRGPSIIYVLVLEDKAIGMVACHQMNSYFDNNKKGYRIKMVYIEEEFRGQELSIKLYQWLLQNKVDFIIPDVEQSTDGVRLWQKLNDSDMFDIYIWKWGERNYRKRWSGRDFNELYNENSDLLAVLTLKGKIAHKVNETKLLENTDKTLYHGTLRRYIPNIMKLGLQPTIGDLTQTMYNEEDYDLPELVFAADKKGLNSCISAIVWLLRKNKIPVTLENIRTYGALIVIKNSERDFMHRDRYDDRYFDFDSYPQVEPGDYFSENPIEITHILTGKKLISFLNRYDILHRYNIPGKKLSELRKIPYDADKLSDHTSATLYKLLKQHGFDYVDSGAFGTVFKNDYYPYVLKIFDNQDICYKNYLNLITTHKNIHFPKIIGKPVALGKSLTAIRIEKLTSESWLIVDGMQFDEYLKTESNEIRKDIITQFGSQMIIALDLIKDMISKNCKLDIKHNLMYRADKTIVIIDPLAYDEIF